MYKCVSEYVMASCCSSCPPVSKLELLVGRLAAVGVGTQTNLLKISILSIALNILYLVLYYSLYAS